MIHTKTVANFCDFHIPLLFPSIRARVTTLMLIDDIKIKVISGNGGRGFVSFSKVLMALWPPGGDGGKGGNVYLEGILDISALNRMRNTKVFHAENGGDGEGKKAHGKDGDDLIISVPIGTVIQN